MERMLLKMAKQLNEYDEASLIALWERYARLVQEFEPSRRWEEAALVFSFIQAVRMKNQLFNKRLAESAKPDGSKAPAEFVREVSAWTEKRRAKEEAKGASGAGKAEKPDIGGASAGADGQKRRKVLRFSRGKDDESV